MVSAKLKQLFSETSLNRLFFKSIVNLYIYRLNDYNQLIYSVKKVVILN